MSRIDGRLKRLEERGPGPCSECGLSAAARRPLAVMNEVHPDKSFEGDPHEACSACGGPLYTVILVVYDPPREYEGGELT
jgi:hypothetical protein